MKPNKSGRDQRRADGERRNAAWRALSPKQQLAELNKRPGESKRQRAKITKLLAGPVAEGA